MQKLKVAVLYDAVEDEEREQADQRGEDPPPLVSEEIAQALSERGHEVRRLPAAGGALDLAGQIARDDSDIIFNVCESFGGVGEQEQNVAALLELFGKRFTGSGSIGLALAQDKALAKMLLGFHEIRTPKFAVMHNGEVGHADDLAFPMFVKPATADASIGIDAGSIVRNVKELMERISFIEEEFDVPALIEEFIEGREIYVGVLGGDRPEALPVLEWDLSGLPDGTPKIASPEAKFDKDNAAFRTPLRVPDDLPEAVMGRLQQAAVDAFKSLKLRDYGRVDMRLRRRDGAPADAPDGWEFYLIEVNPNPHLARNAEVPNAAEKMGLAYADLIERTLSDAMSRPVR
jgi:D-alanine-D-alanine ligase